MVEFACDRVLGQFNGADMMTHAFKRKLSVGFMVFCHLQLDYREFHDAACKFATALEPGGIFVLG